MARRASKVHLAVSAVCVAAAIAACGGGAVVDGVAAPVGAGEGEVDAGAAVDASAPPGDAAVDASAPDAALSACEDPTVCSRHQTRDGCYDRTKVGDFCDFFATPCEPTPRDCATLDGLLGAPAELVDCGAGQSACHVSWVGKVDEAILGALCAARDAVGAPVDCMD